MEPDRPPPSTAEVRSKWIYTLTPTIHLHDLPRVNFTCLRLRPHIEYAALPVLRSAHTDVQFGARDTRRCAGMYMRHTPMCRSVIAAHNDVHFCSYGTHRCAGLYSRHTPMCRSVQPAHTDVLVCTAGTRSVIITRSINDTQY